MTKLATALSALRSHYRLIMSRNTVTDGLVPTTYEAFFSTALPFPCGPSCDLDLDAKVRLLVSFVQDLVVEELGAGGPLEVLSDQWPAGRLERFEVVAAFPVVERGLERLAGARGIDRTRTGRPEQPELEESRQHAQAGGDDDQDAAVKDCRRDPGREPCPKLAIPDFTSPVMTHLSITRAVSNCRS